MKQKAIYPGTFDPITNGHLDIIYRAAKIFPHLTIAVANNLAKRPFFPLSVRMQLIKETLKDKPEIQVKSFNTLLTDFARTEQADIIIRGVRTTHDFEYEVQLATMNRKLSAEIETLFLAPSHTVMFVSSSLVREIALLKGDISQFVPLPVIKTFQEKLANE